MICYKKHITYIFYLSILLLLIVSCKNKRNTKEAYPHDLPEIQKKGKLIAITDYNSISYFIYRGTPMGYQYELLQNLSKHLNLELELIVSNSLEDAFEKLKNNECHLLAINLNINNERKKLINFTIPIGQTRQVLIQKKPENWRKMNKKSIDKHLVRNQLDLAKKDIYVVKNSAFYYRLQNLQDEIGDSIFIKEVGNYEEEQLITLVNKGEIDYTIADENVAKINQTYYPNIDIETPISFPQNQAWAISPNTPLLTKAINNWIKNMENSSFHSYIYSKYFKSEKAKSRTESPYMYIQSGKISPYDALFKKYSKLIDWDWRLLASLVYQESKFSPQIESWAGAYGLMQLMPSTAERFGVSKKSSPSVQIKGGVKFIKWLDRQLTDSILEKDERIKFILAAYNAGLGHIWDARRLAQANGKNPNKWTDEVDFFILNKSNPQYYNKELVKYGYLRGQETYDYVNKIIKRYKLYIELIH